MFVIIETGAVTAEIDAVFLEFVRRNGFTVALFDGGYEPETQVESSHVVAAYEYIRQWLYKSVTDPMFFKVQRGEINQQDWLDGVAQIKRDWVMPEVL